MKKITKKLAACAFGLLIFCIASYAHAAGLTGTWKGLCDNRDMELTLSQAGMQVSGTLELGRETFTVEGSTDNSSDNGTLTLEGTGGHGILPRSCTADFSITTPGEMGGTVTVRSMLGLKIFSGDAMLQNLEQLVDFSLIIGHVQQPSNIYLFFSVQDGNGKPVTGLTQNDFEIYEDDQPISQLESDQTIIPNPSVYTMATVLMLDMSGSILESDTLTPLKESAKAFLEKVAGDEGQEVAIYRFDGREQIMKVIDFTKNKTDLKNAIDILTKDSITGDPGYDISTNLNGAVQQGIAALDTRRGAIATGELFTGSLVTFTDGTDQAGRVSNEAAVASVTASTHYSFTIGLGGEIDEIHLKNLGKSGEAFADDADELNNAFDQIAGTIRSESGKRYVLGYCTPKRSGDHKVTLRVKGRPGALSYAFNADGFTGGCVSTDIPEGMEPGDSGQCLFQIQPDAVRKPSLLPRRVVLTIDSDKVQLTKATTAAIDGLNVVSSKYRRGALRVIATIPPTTEKKAYNVTLNTGAEKITCFNALTVK
jgi:hypothetical protein